MKVKANSQIDDFSPKLITSRCH